LEILEVARTQPEPSETVQDKALTYLMWHSYR